VETTDHIISKTRYESCIYIRVCNNKQHIGGQMKSYNLKDAAAVLGFSPGYTRHLLREGKLQGHKPTGAKTSSWRISEEALEEFLNPKEQT